VTEHESNERFFYHTDVSNGWKPDRRLDQATDPGLYNRYADPVIFATGQNSES
jgi:hypothetical protein